MKKVIQIIMLLLVAVAVMTVLDGFFILEEGEQAVITQFGRPVGAPHTEAGIKLKLPFFQDVHRFEKKILIWDGEPNQIPTNDKTYIHIDNTARWRISNALRFMQAVGNENRAKILLDDIINGTVRDLVNKNDLIEIVRSSDWSADNMSARPDEDEPIGPPEYGRDKIAQMVLESAAKVTPQYGIELLDVMFKRVNYIESVRAKVYERMISERKRIAAEKRSLGEGRKAEILGRVERELREITSNAEREAVSIEGDADAEATKIYGDAYSKHPEFYSFIRSLESYRDILKDNTTLILDSNSDLLRYLEKASPQ